jgi:hypothetical protein
LSDPATDSAVLVQAIPDAPIRDVPFGWLDVFDAEDRALFLDELTTALAEAQEGDLNPLRTCLSDWQTTGHALSDPDRWEILTANPEDEFTPAPWSVPSQRPLSDPTGSPLTQGLDRHRIATATARDALANGLPLTPKVQATLVELAEAAQRVYMADPAMARELGNGLDRLAELSGVTDRP